MAATPIMDPEGFSRMLTAFLATDNNARNEAERVYRAALESAPPRVLVSLVTALASSTDLGVRTVASVMLRQVVLKHWIATDMPTQRLVQEHLLATFMRESDAMLRRRLSHAIAQICSLVPKEDKDGRSSWAGTVLPATLPGTEDADAGRRASATFLVAKVLEFSPEVHIQANARPLQQAFSRLLTDADPRVLVHAVNTAVTFMIRLDSKELRAALVPLNLIQTLLGVFGQFLSVGDEDSARQVLQDIVNAALMTPANFKPQMEHVKAAVERVVGCDTLDTDTRKLSLELLVTLSEAAPGMVRKLPAMVTAAVQLCLKLMLLSEEDGKWATQPYNPEGDTDPADPGEADTCAMVGSESIMRLANALKGDSVLPVFLDALPRIMSADTWQAKRAVLTAMGVMADGCRKSLKPHLPGMVDMVVAHMADPHQRVRHAAVGAAGMLATGMSSKTGKFAVAHGPKLLPALAAVMGAADNAPRTRTHAAMAVISFTSPPDANTEPDEHCPPSALVPHLRPLVAGLAAALTIPSAPSQRQVLFAVSAVAQVAQQALGEFYDSFVAGLQTLLARPVVTMEDRSVLGAAMHCLAHVGATVAPERFADQAVKTMSGIVEMHKAGLLQADDPFGIEVEKAATRICKILGDSSAPYLPVILPGLMASATRDIEMTHEDVEEDSRATADDTRSSVVFEIKGYGCKRVNMNTSAMMERVAAMRMLYEFVTELGAPLAPFVTELYRVTRANLAAEWVHDARLTAAEMVPALGRVLVNHSDAASAFPNFNALIADAVPVLLQAQLGERDPDCRVAQVECMSDLMNICANTPVELDSRAPVTSPPPPLARPLEQCKEILGVQLKVAMASLMRRQARQEELAEKEDVDELEMEQLAEDMEDERSIMVYVVDCIGYMIKAHRAQILPLLEKVVGLATAFLEPSILERDTALFHNGVCVLIDVAEWCGPAGLAAVGAKLLPALLLGCQNDDEEVQQACLYGLGVVATVAPGMLAPHAPALTRLLHAIITAPDSRSEDCVNVTENAVSTLAKMAMHVPGLDRNALLGMWLSALPIRVDEQEAQLNHTLLCDLMEKRDPAVAPHAAKAVGVFAEVMVCAGGGGSDDAIDMVDEATMARIVALLKSNVELVKQAAPTLTPPQQAALQAAMA